MRISDWSSDVCSSDLLSSLPLLKPQIVGQPFRFRNLVVWYQHVFPGLAADVLGVAGGVLAPAHCRSSLGDDFIRFQVIPLLGLGQEDERIHLHNEVGNVLRRSEEHTSELRSLMRSSYAVFCVK